MHQKFKILSLLVFVLATGSFAQAKSQLPESYLECSLENAWSIRFDRDSSQLRLYSEIDKEKDFRFKNVQVVIDPLDAKKFAILTSAGKPLVTVVRDGQGSNGSSDILYPYNMQLETEINGSVHLAPAGCISDLYSDLVNDNN